MTQDRKIWVSAVALALIHAVVLGAAWVVPYDPAEQNRDFPFAPPMRIHFVDSIGMFHFRPFVYLWVNRSSDGVSARYEEDHSKMLPLQFFIRADQRRDAGNPRGAWHLFGVPSPGRVFLLGTDDYGRDQFSRLLYGGQVSLFAGLLAATLSLGLGFLLGGISGYFGSWLDDVIMRGAEVFMALPWIYLLFGARAFLPLHMGPRETFVLLISTIGLTAWARPARLVRGIVLSAKQRDYVRAARGFGGSWTYVLRRHVLPETFPVVLTQAAIVIPRYILAEVTLSFLGLGMGEPVPSWGNMLAGLQRYYVLESYWWMFSSALALVPVFLFYHWLADALQSRLASAESRFAG